MPDSHLVRGTRHHSGTGTPTPGHTHRAVDPTPNRHRRRVTTWARTLAAVVLLDPSAPARAASRDADSAAGRPAPTKPAVTSTALDATDAATDAAAALVVAGDADAAFLLLALTRPRTAPSRPQLGPDPT